MVDHAFPLSSTWSYFSEEYDHLKLFLSQLKYPDILINSTITHSITLQASDEPVSLPAETNVIDPIHIVFPFKDQASADFHQPSWLIEWYFKLFPRFHKICTRWNFQGMFLVNSTGTMVMVIKQ